MIFEEFDRLAPDLTLSEIIEARKRGRLKIAKESRKAGGFKNSEVIAAKLRALREALTGKTIPKPPVTHMNRSVLLRKITEFDARLDRIIHGEDSSGKQERRKVTEFALLPALAGSVLGSGVGAKLSGKKYNATTGKWEDEHGNETSAPGVSSAAGAVAGAGVGLGASKLHSAVMGGYGGADAGVAGAYKTAARNVGEQAGQKITSAIAPSFAEGSDILKKIKASSLLKKFFEANAPRLIELEARLGVQLKKKAVTEFAIRLVPPSVTKSVLDDVDEKKHSFIKPYVAGLLTVPAIGAAAAAAGPGRHILAGAADAIRQRYYKARFPAGSNIPSGKLVEYLRMLHTGKIKV